MKHLAAVILPVFLLGGCALFAGPRPPPPVAVYTANFSQARDGRLTLQRDGRFVMTTIFESSEGTWKQEGPDLVLRYRKGHVEYWRVEQGRIRLPGEPMDPDRILHRVRR